MKKAIDFKFGIEETTNGLDSTVTYALVDYQTKQIKEDFGSDKESAYKTFDDLFDQYMSS